jgi:hypothetical protein
MTSKLTSLSTQKSAQELQTMSRDSIAWLMAKINTIRNPSLVASSIRKETFRESRFKLGGLYFFYYDPKGKDTLPYYDRFPLVLALQKYPDGFLGLNIHYLPVKYRVAFMGKLMDYASLDDSGDIKRMRITYDILTASRRFREFKPCIKRYLNSHVKSKILAVQPNEWDVATLLPVQQFKGAKPDEIWKESVEEIRNN